MKQWEKDFDKLFVEQRSHRGGKIVREEASKIIDFIRETREQAEKEEMDRVWKIVSLRIKYDKRNGVSPDEIVQSLLDTYELVHSD